MKENSIEEDIILLKDFTEGNFKRDKLENYKGSYKMGYFYYKDIQQAIEHLLSDYKKLQKEKKELEEINNELEAEKNEAIRRYNFETIPIKKVKDKIEALNQYYKKEIYPILYQWGDITITEHYDEMIELLRELIKESEE